MATKIGDLYFEVSADTSGARSSIVGIGGAAAEAAGIVAGVLTTAIGAAALAAATGAAIATKEILEMGAAFNTASQSAYALFTALTGSLDEATTLMREFAELSLESPIFDSGQLQRTQSLLLTFGIASDQAFELAQNINIAAIALDRGTVGAQQLARAIGQIQGRGWLEGDEARQLSEVGINAYKAIADAAGLTVAEVMKLGREHKLLAEDVIPILAEQLETTFGPVGQNLLNTYSVQVQGIKNLLTGVGSALVDPFIGRTGGGAITDLLRDIRSELDGVVEVAEDGSFRLVGALEPLGDLSQAIADGFAEIGESVIGSLSGFDGTGFANFIDDVAGRVPDLVEDLKDFAAETVDFFQELGSAIGPLLPVIGQTLTILFDFGREALPIIADGFVDLVRAAAPIAAQFLEMANAVLEFASPAIIDLLQATADTLEIIADIVGPLASLIDDLVVAWVAWKVAIIAADIATATYVSVTLSPLLATIAAIAPAIGIALAALASFKAISAGVKGDTDWLFADRPFYEKPFQLAGQFGLALGGGTENFALTKQAFEVNQLLEEGRVAGEAYADALDDSSLSMAEFSAQVRDAGLTVEGTNFALIRYREILDEIQAANVAAGREIDAFGAANMFEARVADAFGGASAALNTEVEETIDLMKELNAAARDAWEEVTKLMRADEGATIDDFFRSLPDLATDLTDALSLPPGVLNDLEISGVLQDVSDSARKVIQTLARDYGMSLSEIEAMFDERGLAGVIEALGAITEETTETVDPLIAKYGQLGATADQLRDAIGALEDQRQTRIQGQIDAVQAALEGARDAAEQAREAVREFLSGGYLDSPQELVDDLIGDIGNVGSAVEDALRQGGVRGESAIRGALADIQGQIADIVNAGLEAGLSGQQIVDLLGPVLTALDEEMSDARNRISSLDWTEGFTPAAASTIASMLEGILDPAAIQRLLNDILGADANVAGLEGQLENLQAQMRLEVEFSPEQVQGALEEIETTVITEVVTTPEAAQAVYDEIQRLFDDEDLKAAIDKALLTQDILDAAKEAERQLTLVFQAGLNFDSDWVRSAAEGVSAEFFNAFNDQMSRMLDERAQAEGFDSYYDMQRSLGPLVTSAIVGGTTLNQTINNDITVNDVSGDPRSTASETIAASSAAAGSGGSYDPGKYFGTTVIPGYRGPQ